MLDSAQEAIAFASGRSRADLDTDRMFVLSLVKAVEIIGEAAFRISSEMKDRYPQLPWQEIITMRHRLVHGYYDVNLDILWATVTKDLPPLIHQLESMIRAENQTP